MDCWASISLCALSTNLMLDHPHLGELMSNIVKSTKEMLLTHWSFIRELVDPDGGLVGHRRGPSRFGFEVEENHFIKISKTVFYEVNLVSQCSHLEVLLLSKFWSERGDFN